MIDSFFLLIKVKVGVGMFKARSHGNVMEF